ncbi:hypothetical protein KP509_01G078800 [Ceratopteris richardii]|nr:hypothetical protein KP509_01G078800 [Ceratopteris richardii]
MEHTRRNLVERLLHALLDTIEKMIVTRLETNGPLPSTADPKIQLHGNFFPVPENEVQHELHVQGRIPPTIEGIYVRNGPNPMFKPVAGYNFFDGDGMLHAVRFKQGNVSYANRFTCTYRLQQEMKLGRAFFPKSIGELHGHSGLARLMLYYVRCAFGLVHTCKGVGVANTGAVFFNGHLLAMSEDDLPYAVKFSEMGDLKTLGRYDFNGQLKSSMIAHPKIDIRTGELFALGYDIIQKPFLKCFKFSADGKKSPEVNISVKQPTMVHDFAITENYIVVPDQQIIFQLQEMLKGGSPVVYVKDKMPRFGLLPRNDVNEERMTWINVPDCFCFHLWNAWEENEEIVIIASCMTPPDGMFNEASQSVQSILSEIRLNMTTKTSSRRPLISSMTLEAGQVNKRFLGHKSQFVYLAIVDPWPKVCGIAKVDLSGPKKRNALSLQELEQCDDHHIAAKFMYPRDCYGGEPMFVPRSSTASTPEDDGYLLTFMHNENTNKSELLILDARSPTLQMLASVKLPTRVPYGLHGTFITSEELEHQNDI